MMQSTNIIFLYLYLHSCMQNLKQRTKKQNNLNHIYSLTIHKNKSYTVVKLLLLYSEHSHSSCFSKLTYSNLNIFKNIIVFNFFSSDDSDVVSNYFRKNQKGTGLLSFLKGAQDSILPQRARKQF